MGIPKIDSDLPIITYTRSENCNICESDYLAGWTLFFETSFVRCSMHEWEIDGTYLVRAPYRSCPAPRTWSGCLHLQPIYHTNYPSKIQKPGSSRWEARNHLSIIKHKHIRTVVDYEEGKKIDNSRPLRPSEIWSQLTIFMIFGEFAVSCSRRSILLIDELHSLETCGYLLQDLLASVGRSDLSR